MTQPDREVVNEWGIFDGLFIDGKELRVGPPPTYKKIRNKIAKKAGKKTIIYLKIIPNTHHGILFSSIPGFRV